jgi:hypothetical protein
VKPFAWWSSCGTAENPAPLRSFLILSLCLLFGLASPLHAQTGTLLGLIDGVLGEPGAQSIQGWACETGNPKPLTVQLYTDGGHGRQLYRPYLADATPNDLAMSQACGTSTGHRFQIPVGGDLFSRAGQKIVLYGVGPSGPSAGPLEGSEKYSIPAPTTHGQVESVDVNGYAKGWAFDQTNPNESIRVAVYADGEPALGAETGKLVWEGLADQADPNLDTTERIHGNHGFQVQLPSWVTAGVHRLSLYAVSLESKVDAPLAGSPATPGGSTVASHFSVTNPAPGFPTQWFGYRLPAGQLNFTGLTGTVTMANSANIFSEILFIVTYLPSGACPTEGTTDPNGPPGLGPSLWSDIIKGPTTGYFSDPVNFTLPVGIPISNCLIVGFGGGTVAGAHPVTGTVNLVANYTQKPDESTQILGLDSEFCFGQNWGCEAATTDDTQSFAAVTQVMQRSKLNTILGNISDSTFDGSANFGPLPAEAWSSTNDVYLYPASSCSQFPAGRSFNGPGNYLRQVPPDATLLLHVPLTGSAGAVAGETVNYLQPGMTNGIVVNQAFSNVTLNAGECLVVLYGMQHTTGAFDNEDQLRAIVTAY